MNTSSWRSWLYGCLITLTAGLMFASFLMPWWTAHVAAPYLHFPADTIRIYGYGLRHSLGDFQSFIVWDETPLYQTVLAWIYLGISVVFFVVGAFLKKPVGRIVQGISGLGLIAYALVAAFIVISGRLSDFGFALQGTNTMESGQVILTSRLRFGYYLTFMAAGLSLILAQFGDRMRGRS